MLAVCWNGKKDVRVETVPDPAIINPRDGSLKPSLRRSAAPICTFTMVTFRQCEAATFWVTSLSAKSSRLDPASEPSALHVGARITALFSFGVGCHHH